MHYVFDSQCRISLCLTDTSIQQALFHWSTATINLLRPLNHVKIHDSACQTTLRFSDVENRYNLREREVVIDRCLKYKTSTCVAGCMCVCNSVCVSSSAVECLALCLDCQWNWSWSGPCLVWGTERRPGYQHRIESDFVRRLTYYEKPRFTGPFGGKVEGPVNRGTR